MEVSDEEEVNTPPRVQRRKVQVEVDKSPLPKESGVSTMENMMEQLTHKILNQVGDLVNARFAALDERLLPEIRARPPLGGQAQVSTKLRTSQ